MIYEKRTTSDIGEVCLPSERPSRRFTSARPVKSASSWSTSPDAGRGVLGCANGSPPATIIKDSRVRRAGLGSAGLSRNVTETVRQSNGSKKWILKNAKQNFGWREPQLELNRTHQPRQQVYTSPPRPGHPQTSTMKMFPASRSTCPHPIRSSPAVFPQRARIFYLHRRCTVSDVAFVVERLKGAGLAGAASGDSAMQSGEGLTTEGPPKGWAKRT